MKKIILILAILFSISLSAQDPIETNKKYNFTIDGDTIELTEIVEPPQNEVYVFDKREWNIYEGKVSDEKALHNREQMNTAIQFAKAEGYTVFEIGDLNAYFDVQAGFGGSKIENYRRSIQLPSNFHLKMSENTHLRVQPNDKRDYALLCAFSEENVKVSGGNIWGDRFTHDYVGGDTGPQDLGYGIYFIGVLNGEIDNVVGNEFTGDAVVVSSPVVRKDDGSENYDSHYGKVNFSKNFKLTNSTFDQNRRNALALTDVIGAVIEGNTFLNTGLGQKLKGEPYSWKGYTPKHAIDLEAINPVDTDTGELRITERVEDVIIRYNVFKGNYGDIDFYKCSRVEVYGNWMDSGSGGVGGFDVKFYNNEMISAKVNSKRAINVKPLIREDGSHFVRDWEIYSNTIVGYDIGMQVGGENQKVYGNTITDFNDGIFLLEGKDVYVNNNTLESERDNARGFYNYNKKESAVGIDAVNYTLIRNTVKTTGNYAYGFLFKKVIAENFIIDDCHFDSRVKIENSQNINIQNSTFPSYNFSKGNTNIQDINNN